MYDSILIPTDGSPAADAACEHGLNLAERYGATVHALYVIDGSMYASLEAGADVVLDSLKTEGERAVGAIEDAGRERGVTVTTAVSHGAPHAQILEYADESDVDLIVMGTHGRTGLNRYLLGSVTERVVRSSDVPVLTVRQEE
ncbi:universal stress protein [Natronocalculus amylovorans]|uniref:Universal stress protein n=1 Tax=Natronocalculus amylovorans TaxID=2917812 RepID=A0AAE3FX19_9EURY|nr:universal stress protein [Natronocalculus amylovorans]MCL9816924.1 universal stress protein [Natronocalculus amylovorans]NUE03014.1 universal stress protein [Halorubraceae archaeon YAN]